MSWRVTLHCTRAEAEALPESADLFAHADEPPVIVADEPDPHAPDDWRIHAYFAEQPTTQELVLLRRLAADSEPEVEHLEDTTDWVTMSQSGARADPRRPLLRPHADALCRPARRTRSASRSTPASPSAPASMTTTAGCLAALDRLEREGKRFANIADIGTGTGLLAFAAMALWPEAKAIATDIDQIAIEVTEENAAINGVRLGHGAGELLLAVADGMDHPLIAARAPFDLLIANILAGPLIELAPAFAESVAPGASVVLAGLLDTQADAVIAAYEAEGMKLVERGAGEWCVLVLEED